MPGTEDARLAALKSHLILDTPPEPGFDDIAALAADLFGAPMALVTLVDEQRLWFKARVGLDLCETPREHGFCAHALALPRNAVMVVEDAREDPRFAASPLVAGPPFIRFYAGALLTDPAGCNLGTLCILDVRPRPRPSEAELSRLQNLARRVVDQLERRDCARQLAEQRRIHATSEAMSGVGHWRLDLKTGRASASDELYRIYGVEPYRGELTAEDLPVILRLNTEEQEAARAMFARAARDRTGYESERAFRRADGEERHVSSRAVCEFDGGQVTAIFGVVQDITERKQAFERVRKAQLEVFETAFTHASIGMALVSLEGRFNKVNQAFCQIVGYSEDEILDLDFQRITHPDDLDSDLALLDRLLAGEIESYTLDKRYIRKDGGEASVHLAVALVRAPDGAPRHFIAQVQDLTARRDVESRYRLLAENVGDIVSMYDGAGRCLYMSPSAERLLGYPLHQLMVGSHLPFVPAYAHDRFRQAMRQFAMAQPGETVTHQTPFRHKDGHVLQLEVAGRVATDDGGRPVVISVTRDVTARLETERRYRLLAENIADMLVLANLDGRATFIAGACERVMGWTAEEILALRGEVLAHPDDFPAVQQVYRRVGAGEQGLQVRFRSRAKDGSWRWLESHPSLLVEEDGTRSVVDAVHDITDQVAQEAALAEARKKAEAANRAKAEFLANMSHELRTPLNGVIGFSRLLAESTDLSDADRRRVLLVRDAGEALNRLINDVLDFSKLEAGAVQLEARPFSVGDMVSEALSMVEPQAAEKAVALRICGDDPGVLVGDKHRLRQVVLNFLSNAVKFTEQGTVTVRLSSEDVGERRVRLHVQVIDEGTGIPQDKLPLLFRRFSQADGSITRTYGGTGLGLAISRELIELMDGQVGVETELGVGSTFWFEVEMPRGEAAPRRDKTRAGRASFPGRRVLVVDDVALNRELFLEMIEQHGCEVDLACDGEEAVAAVRRAAYDLVLMDVHMPVMDGMAATQAIRAAGFGALPIVALTASGTPEQVESCLAAGMNGHLLKPLSPQDLERSLARTFEAAPPAAASAAPSDARDSEAARARHAFAQSMGQTAALKLARMFEAQLAERFVSAERETLQSDAHKVGGTAAMLGFLDLGEAARELEAACRDGQPYAADLARTRAAKREAEVVLRDWCAALAREG